MNFDDPRLARLQAETSMLYWWPRIKDLGIPVPRTEIVRFRPVTIAALTLCADEPETREQWLVRHNRVRRAIERLGKVAFSLGQPMFIRTDQGSGKHRYRETCFVEDVRSYPMHVYRLAEEMLCADVLGLPWRAIVFREFIPLAARFEAFSGRLPIAPERRYFVRDGQVECHHPYWQEEAVERGIRPADDGAALWRRKLAEMNVETPAEVELLTDYATRVAKALPGYWSVDFALAADGRWILIDMARGEVSFHWAGCLKAVDYAALPALQGRGREQGGLYDA